MMMRKLCAAVVIGVLSLSVPLAAQQAPAPAAKPADKPAEKPPEPKKFVKQHKMKMGSEDVAYTATAEELTSRTATASPRRASSRSPTSRRV